MKMVFRIIWNSDTLPKSMNKRNMKMHLQPMPIPEKKGINAIGLNIF